MLPLDHQPAYRSRSRYRICRTTTVVPLLLLLTVTLSLLIAMKDSADSVPVGGGGADTQDWHYEYETMPGYFLQSDSKTNDKTFDFKDHNFGLVDRSYESDNNIITSNLTQWQRFNSHLTILNRNAPERTTYRLLFLGRHGQGFHNVAEAYYGMENWDCYWSLLEGNGTVTWAYAHLTQLGIDQAREARDYWATMIAEQRIVPPSSFYLSPLDRAINTAEVTFRDLPQPYTYVYRPIVKELLREGNGLHTCDRRSNRADIASRWPDVSFEDSFSEKDELWRADAREPMSEVTKRVTHLLDDIFEHDNGQIISLTAHSGAIAGLLAAIKHRSFRLQTGGVIPVLVKVEKKEGRRKEGPEQVWEPKPDCSGKEHHIRRDVKFADFMNSPASKAHV